MRNITELKTKDFYNTITKNCSEYPIGFNKWNITLKIIEKNKFKHLLHFIFHYIKENKIKIFRWKLTHFILPCKQLLYKWCITSNDQCSVCKVTEDYEHMFITCQYLDQFWSKIKVLLQKVKIDAHILNYTCLIGGYKINDTSYYDINFFLTIILFTIYKGTYVSEQKDKKIDIYSLFKKEFHKRSTTDMKKQVNKSVFLSEILNNI